MTQPTPGIDTAVTTTCERSDRDASTVLRIGLGIVIFFSGIHKLLAPVVWSDYLAPLFARRWPISISLTMVVFGLSELPVGVYLIIDRHTLAAAAIVAISMVGTVINLAIAVLQTGRFVDVLIRDIGVLVLALGVVLIEVTNRSNDERE